MAVLHVVLIDANQNLWHTVRRLDGSWFPFGNVRGVVLSENPGSLIPGPFLDVDCTGAGNDLHVCLQTSTDQLLHTVRYINGRWSPFGDVASVAGAPGRNVRSIAATGLNGQLHMGAAISTLRTENPLFYAIRSVDGTAWRAFQGFGGSFDNIALAGVGGEVHFCGINYDVSGSRHHELQHALRPVGGGPFTPFGDVATSVRRDNPDAFDPFDHGSFDLSGPPPRFFQVSCAGLGGDLHVFVLSDIAPRGLFRTRRFAGGNWGAFRDVVADYIRVFPPPVPVNLTGVSCAAVNGELHVICLERDGKPWHIRFRADGTPLQPFGDVVTTVLAQNPGSPVPAAIRFVAIADSF